MDKINSFPLSKVKKISSYYNKSFHSKFFTLFASSNSEIYTMAHNMDAYYDFCFAFMKDDEGQWFVDIDGIERVRNWILDGAKKDIKHVMKYYINWQKDFNKLIMWWLGKVKSAFVRP